MKEKKSKTSALPKQENTWFQCVLPEESQPWLSGKRYSIRQHKKNHKAASQELQSLLKKYPWKWPKRPIIFLTDPHADGEAFMASLVASGGICKTGSDDKDFELTPTGQESLFILGGDYFDKGPNNLRLIRCLNLLRKKGARLRILAGNHDLRVMYGMRCVGMQGDTGNEHFFIRMGNKAIPLLKEINDEYLKKSDLKELPSESECRALLYPADDWYERFPKLADGILPPPAIEKELGKIRIKSKRFAERLEAGGLSMRQAYGAALKWQELFWHPKGEFSWLFNDIRIALHKGSFLFAHAGLGDAAIEQIRDQGVHDLNAQFVKQIRGLPFDFYYGPIANLVRTKYRAVDLPLTQAGSTLAHRLGIHAIIQGHRNLRHGQRIALRKNLINFECDTTMDINSRKNEKIPGYGAGVMMISPEKVIVGISSDHKYKKVFDYSSLIT